MFEDLPALRPVSAQDQSASPSQGPPSDPAYPANRPERVPEPVDGSKTALMHPSAGLVVSLNMKYVPRIVKHPQFTSNQKLVPYTCPRLVQDEDLYLAFLATNPRNIGPLFERLGLNDEALDARILKLDNGRFVLDHDVAASWFRLEEALYDAAFNLLRSKKDIPSLPFPERPNDLGYLNAHVKRSAAVSCAKRSRDQFNVLSAVLTLAIALHMDDEGSVGPAFIALRSERRKCYQQTSHAWWDLLCESYVCDFNANFRVGAVIDPHFSLWMPYLKQFAQTRVPLWLLWGPEQRNMQVNHPAAWEYFPPQNIISGARCRMMQATTIILPSYTYDPYSISQGAPLVSAVATDAMDTSGPEWVNNSFHEIDADIPQSTNDSRPDATSAPTAPSSPDPAHAAAKAEPLSELRKVWDELASRREDYIAKENAANRQKRESWEEHAKKTGGFTNNCTMYIWELKDGTYVREKVNKKQYEVEWSNRTPNQRRYTPHLNRWDLCSDFPTYTDENPMEADPDAYDDDEYSEGENFHNPTVNPADAYALDPPPASAHRTIAVKPVELIDSLLHRFGWDIAASSNWNVNDTGGMPLKQLGMVLGFRPDFVMRPAGLEEAQFRAALDAFIKSVSSGSLRSSELPDAFDHGTRKLPLDSAPLKVFIASGASGPVYVVHPPGHPDIPSWVISTPDAATVLLIYRLKLYSMESIARELTRRGARFGTVNVACSRALYPAACPTRGLGLRSEEFVPSKEDYNEYLRRREVLLQGPRGRAALMHGGLVSRIARDVLDVDVVLKGPSAQAATVALHHRYTLEDDYLTNNELDIICGVYYVKNNGKAGDDANTEGGEYRHYSWWPRAYAWEVHGGYNPAEWTQLAEDFYQNYLKLRETNLAKSILASGKWKQEIRKQKTLAKKFLSNSELLQAAYLENYLRASRCESFDLIQFNET